MRYLRSMATTMAEMFIGWFYNIIKSILSDISSHEATFMAKVAFQDFKNYLKNKLKVSKCESVENLALREMENMLLNPNRYNRELKEWTELWLQKWKERVKVVLSDEDVKRQRLMLSSDINTVIRRLRFWRELKEIIIGALIEKGEICFTDIISENILRAEVDNIFKKLGDINSTVSYLEKNPVHLLNRALNRVKIISSKRAPLVLVKIDTSMINYMY
ncbi:MAG: hypothetical protein DRN53_06865 [Thermoprotei archaeon]|nr:MAG: hypothetical protein DRN53_06865 [Thermoprotei archaeon]